MTCPTDAEAVAAVTKLRAALPKGQALLSAASFHVGCYGTGAFAASKPATAYTGINLAMARSDAGQSLDLINIMAYDAGNLGSTGFDPKESLRAHRAAWPTATVALGVEVRALLVLLLLCFWREGRGRGWAAAFIAQLFALLGAHPTRAAHMQ